MSFFRPFLHFPFCPALPPLPSLPLSPYTQVRLGPFSFSAFCSLIVVASDVRDLNDSEARGWKRSGAVEIFPLCRAKVCQDEEIDSRFALSWLLITKIISLLHSLSPFLPLSFFITFLAPFETRSTQNALLFEIVLPLAQATVHL